MEELFERALKLPEEQHAAMAHNLLLTLESEGQDEDYEEAWAEEIQKRSDSIDNGTAKLLTWDEVEASAKEAIAKVQAS